MNFFLTSALIVAGLGWTITRPRRRLRKPDEIIANLHPGELKGLHDFLPGHADKDLLETDVSFWIQSKGMKGLIRKRHNAVCFVQLCQQLHRNSSMPEDEIGDMTTRAFLISFFIGCAILENLPRLFIRGLPHACARFATEVYWEAAVQMRMLNLEYGIEDIVL